MTVEDAVNITVHKSDNLLPVVLRSVMVLDRTTGEVLLPEAVSYADESAIGYQLSANGKVIYSGVDPRPAIRLDGVDVGRLKLDILYHGGVIWSTADVHEVEGPEDPHGDVASAYAWDHHSAVVLISIIVTVFTAMVVAVTVLGYKIRHLAC